MPCGGYLLEQAHSSKWRGYKGHAKYLCVAHLPDMEEYYRQNTPFLKTAQEILATLKNALINKTTLSLIRYGDGEAMVLDGIKNPDVMSRVFKRQLSMVSFEDGLKIRENLVLALAQADILGIPYGKKMNEPESYWFRAQSILAANVPVMDKVTCSIDIHYDLLDEMWQLFELTPRIYYIRCRDLRDRMQNKYGKEVKAYHIAPEAAFTTYEGPRHYPDQFVKIESWMDKQDLSGCLCLVGGGIVGKTYCNWFRDRGGIAIDMGSVFDQWAGYVTRGPERARDKRTNEGNI